MSTYTSNIPAATDLISTSQGQIQGNFNAIVNTSYGLARNHVAITDGTDGGLHTRVDFQQAVSSPSISGFASSIYPFTVSANAELYYKNAAADMRITNSALTASSGQGMMPGGLQVRAGSGTILNGNSSQAIAWTAFPTGAVSVVCTPISTNTIIQAQSASLGVSGFTALRSGTTGGASFYYIAIGY